MPDPTNNKFQREPVFSARQRKNLDWVLNLTKRTMREYDFKKLVPKGIDWGDGAAVNSSLLGSRLALGRFMENHYAFLLDGCIVRNGTAHFGVIPNTHYRSKGWPGLDRPSLHCNWLPC